MGFLTVLALVALRVGVGWHFFQEGTKKFHDPNWTSSGFLGQAVGPLSGYFHQLVPDQYGHQRLDKESIKRQWKDHATQVANEFGFNADQRDVAERTRGQWAKRLDWFFQQNQTDIDEYFLEVQRLQDNRQRPDMREIPFGQERLQKKHGELSGKLRGWLGSLSPMHDQYHHDLVAIASETQRAQGRPAMPNTASPMDTVVKYTIAGVGACLVLGLFTRTASLVGALFLCSVMATQPPWVVGAQTMFSYYQSVEILALLLLAAVGAGKFAGLDFFIHSLRMRCCPPGGREEVRYELDS